MARKYRASSLPSPWLKRIWVDDDAVGDRNDYPFCLPLFRAPGFEFSFESPITIIVGENGTGKSTLLEAIAVLAGFDEAGGGQDHRPVDHSEDRAQDGGALAAKLKASWLPKMGRGWFFRAESFFAVARYLDESGSRYADFLSHSHGEGFMRFFEERCGQQGLFIFDEPESALSPNRQFEFLKLLKRLTEAGTIQAIIATHSPILMAMPDADLWQIDRGGMARARLEDISHYRVWREFILDPKGTVEAMLDQ
jgi:predicted ATPase